jgi:LAGLIDADG DNA endonuclease family protein
VYPSGTRPRLEVMVRGSDNPNGAENQQERLIRTGWVVGFVDGEGCFSIGFVRQPDRTSRKGYKTGYQVAHSFVVVQGAKSADVLTDLQSFFGVGAVTINRRHDNHKEHLHRYTVSRRDDLLGLIIPFFEANPLRTSKREDFERFSRCVRICNEGRHLTAAGLIEIAELAEGMNHRKSRQDLIGILRGHTPNALDTGR